MLGLTIPIHAVLLPVFLILRSFHMLNTFASLFLPYASFALAMAIMICNSFMGNIPEELEEAACIDGCGTFGIFFRHHRSSDETGRCLPSPFLLFSRHGMS